MKRAILFCLLVALLGASATAGAQNTGSVVLFGSGGGPGATVVDIPVVPTGQLEITFHGDPSTGCFNQGLCGYSGTVIVRPGSLADIAVSETRPHGHPSYQVEMRFAGAPAGAETAAHVTRAGAAGVCGDVQQPNLPGFGGSVAAGTATIPLLQPQGALLGTRCAGPLDGDLAAVAPRISLPIRALLRGRATLDLSGDRSFAAGGFAGTMTSSLTMSLGRPRRERNSTAFPPGPRLHRIRQVTETLSVERAQGATNFGVSGEPNTCQFLDSCGVSGSITGTIVPAHPQASFTVLGPASRPYRDFLAALGLGHGNPRGLTVVGGIDWPGGGTVSSNLQQGTACLSQAPLGGGVIELTGTPRRLVGSYSDTLSLGTRCPGPRLSNTDHLATASLDLRQVGRRAFTLRLNGSGQVSDDGYTVDQRTTLSLTLRRGTIHQVTLSLPGG